jgi:hypothetical protein
MQDIIPISIDDRRFTIWNWLGFLCGLSFFTLHLAGFAGGMLANIWGNIWVSDFSKTDLILAVALTIIALPALVALYGILGLGLADAPFVRGSVLLETQAGHLILKRRHITGFCCRKSISLADIWDLNVSWNRGDDGEELQQLVLIPKGTPVCPIITNPKDADDLPALAIRLRAELASAGWSDPFVRASAAPGQARGSVV